jgi:hypothetical protein
MDLAALAARQNGQPQPPSGKNPLRSRGTAPHERNSASLEGWTPIRLRSHLARGLDVPSVRFRLARGSHGLAAPTPAPLTGAFNVLTHAGALVKDESAPRLWHAWKSYPGVVPSTLPVRPSPPLYDTMR